MSNALNAASLDPEKTDAAHLALNLLDGLPHPVLLIGEGDTIAYANAAAEDFFQTSCAVLRRQSLGRIAAFGSPLVALVDHVRRHGSKVNEYGVDLGSPQNGGGRLVDVHCSPVAEAQGKIMVVLQQRSMAQMIERQLTHRGAARSVSGLAAVLAHEIKNPLSGIRGAAQLLESAINDEDRSLTQLICTESDRICDLVDRMEVFGDERPLTKEAVNIHDVLDHVKKIAEAGFASHIQIVEEYDPSLPAIPGSRDKLIQAFLNLIKNASEAIGEDRSDGKIVLSTSFRPGVRLSLPGSATRISLPLEIAITDNGPGVPAELQPHLFEPFVTTKSSGNGLGLALVAKFIGDHGGVIECDSSAQGTVFRALMPVQDAEAEMTGIVEPE
ncbi:MAG: ATP-binding protein [Hyphomicrobiaceae bacterium]|nr:ATP-binding protein [Hyphomicrobiaceae bacterium]